MSDYVSLHQLFCCIRSFFTCLCILFYWNYSALRRLSPQADTGGGTSCIDPFRIRPTSRNRPLRSRLPPCWRPSPSLCCRPGQRPRRNQSSRISPMPVLRWSKQRKAFAIGPTGQTTSPVVCLISGGQGPSRQFGSSRCDSCWTLRQFGAVAATALHLSRLVSRPWWMELTMIIRTIASCFLPGL